jgi:hypothetical protein
VEARVVTDRDRSVVAWIAVVGAVSAQDVMARFGVGRTVGYRRLRALVDHGLLTRRRLVHGQPALYVATREGLAWAGLSQVEPARVNVSTTRRHWAVGARLAVILDREPGGGEVWGEPRLRAAELEAGRAIASAQLGRLPDGRPRLRRPDLVLFPPDPALPIAVEVELSVKGARRLEAICRAWALPARLRGALLRAAARSACRFPCRFGRARPDRIRVLSLEEALKEARDVRFAA